MKQRFFRVLVRNVTISGIVTVILMNSHTLYDAFAAMWAGDRNFRIGVVGATLVVLLYSLIYFCVLPLIPIKSKPKLTSKPYTSIYGVGWPLHTAVVGALLTMYAFMYAGGSNSISRVTFMWSIFIFVCVYLSLAGCAWLWIYCIATSHEYMPRNSLSKTILSVRSSLTV